MQTIQKNTCRWTPKKKKRTHVRIFLRSQDVTVALKELFETGVVRLFPQWETLFLTVYLFLLQRDDGINMTSRKYEIGKSNFTLVGLYTLLLILSHFMT